MANTTPRTREKRTQRRLRRFRILWLVLAILAFVSCLFFLTRSKKHLEDFENWYMKKWLQDEYIKYKNMEDMPKLKRYLRISLFFVVGVAYLSVVFALYLFSKLEKFWKFRAIAKFVIASILPGISLLGSEFCKNDPNAFVFIIMAASSLLFIMLAFRTPEDFGITDMLVAIGLAFFAGPLPAVWKLFLGALPAATKPLIPLFAHYVFKENSVVADVEPSVREPRPEGVAITRDELKELVDNVHGISQILQDNQKIQELGNKAKDRGSSILEDIETLKSRLVYVS